MYARLTRFEGPPERIDEAGRGIKDEILPRVREMDGFRGLTMLADRISGTAITIGYWDSEDALRASEDAASEIRSADDGKRLQAWRDAGPKQAKKPKSFYKLEPVFDRAQVDPLPPPAKSA